MRELSLNILDVVENSVEAGASLVTISETVQTYEKKLVFSIRDNGCGMDKETAENVMSPFYTTRTTRNVGLGVPFFKMAAEMTGGSFSIRSVVGEGTNIYGEFKSSHIDCPPTGAMAETIAALIQGNTGVDFVYKLCVDGREFTADTREIKDLLEGVPLDTPTIVIFLKEFLNDNIKLTYGGVMK